ncbi:hypothetical protein R1sor_026557 [Riccia sorocarpa]|uniref:RNA 3'-terminal phosphate cyclase domain-containing protein n=1 Tax=Riccia sorocarpa TaxID=122646 RepID=A0ABD3GHE5_9MARC
MRGAVRRIRGSQQLRLRLVLATLSGTTFRVDDIRATSAAPGTTDDIKDRSVDTFSTTLPMLKQFGISYRGSGTEDSH